MANGELADRDEGQAQSPLCRGASAPPMGHRSGSGIRASNIYRAMKPGLSANTAAQAKRNTISPICLLRPICALWLPPSRHVGFASKPISS